MGAAQVIQITLEKNLPEDFKSEVVEAVGHAIKAITRQYYGEKLAEDEVEICVSKLYSVKSRAEARDGDKK